MLVKFGRSPPLDFTIVLGVGLLAFFAFSGTNATKGLVAARAGGPFEPTIESTATPPGDAPSGMLWIPGGEFSMGAEDPTKLMCGGRDRLRDARPIHRVQLDGFWIDETEVTNSGFSAFIKATGYVTVAECKPRGEDFHGAQPEALIPGSLVFTPTQQSVPLDNFLQWRRYQPGADWRHPEGPASSIEKKDNYPVIHVAYQDAAALRSLGRQTATD